MQSSHDLITDGLQRENVQNGLTDRGGEGVRAALSAKQMHHGGYRGVGNGGEGGRGGGEGLWSEVLVGERDIRGRLVFDSPASESTSSSSSIQVVSTASSLAKEMKLSASREDGDEVHRLHVQHPSHMPHVQHLGPAQLKSLTKAPSPSRELEPLEHDAKFEYDELSMMKYELMRIKVKNSRSP
jgi:hypothetical protein